MTSLASLRTAATSITTIPAPPKPTAADPRPAPPNTDKTRPDGSPPTPNDLAPSCFPQDPACACPTTAEGKVTLCGYVDSDWHRLEKRQAPAANAMENPPVASSSNASKDDISRSERIATFDALLAQLVQPIPVEHVEEVELSAMQALNASILFPSANTVIRNLEHADTRGRFVVGLKGVFPADALIRGEEFLQGDFWQLRWDFAWFDGEGRPSAKPHGAHIEIRVQSLNGKSAAYAFYPSKPEVTKAPQPGDWYFTNILEPLRNMVGFDPETLTFEEGEQAAAQKFAKAWLKASNMD